MLVSRPCGPRLDRRFCADGESSGMTSRWESDGHVQMLLGAYLMGGLAEDDVAAVRAHLEVCADCKAEHDDLAPVPGWLSLLSEAPGRPHLSVARDPEPGAARAEHTTRAEHKGRGRRPRRAH